MPCSWFHQLIVCGFAVLSISAPARGAEDFKMLPQSLHIPERGEVTSYLILTASNRFSFLPPPAWNVSESAAEKSVTCVPDDFGAKISFKIIPGISRNVQDLRTDAFRNEVAARYPGARVVGEFRCYTGGKSGLAFDVERSFEKRPPVTSRLAFVPFEGGLVEFELTTETRRFSHYHLVLGNLLTSFRIEAIPSKK